MQVRLPDGQSLNVFYRKAAPLGKTKRSTTILLHGMAANADGSSDVWLEVDTMQLLAASGHEVLAPDLPGESKQC